MSLNQDTTPGFPSNLTGTVKKVDASTPVDNVFTYSSAGSVWQRIFDGGVSLFRAIWFKVGGAPTDLSPRLVTALANPNIQVIEVDTTLNTDSLVDFGGKTLRVTPGGIITGAYNIQNAVITGDYTQKLFDISSGGTITNSKNASGKWLPTQFGATGDGVTDDYAAINYTNTVANTNVQKIINLLPGTYNIGTNLAISSGVLLDFEHGAVIDGAVTLSGSSAQYSARPTQWVFGTSLIVSGVYPQSGETSPMHFGAVGNELTDDSVAFNKISAYVATLGVNLINIKVPARTYFFGSTFDLPGDLGTGRWLKIDAYGAAFTTNLDIPLIRRMPANQTIAMDTISSYVCTMAGFRILGNSTVASPKTSQVGILIGAAYNWRFQDIAIQDLYTGIEIQFGLKCIIDNVTGTSAWIGINGRYGSWSGASVSNSSFNANTIRNCKIFNRGGAYTSLQLLGADQTYVKDFISEGQNPQYNIVVNGSGNTGVLINTFEDVWFESVGGIVSSNTNFNFISIRGMMILKRIQRIYPNKFWEGSSVGTCTLLVEECPWFGTLPASEMFQNILATIIFKILRSSDEAVVFDTANWVGGTLPVNLYLEYINGSEQSTTQMVKTSSNGVAVIGTGTNRNSLLINTINHVSLAGIRLFSHQSLNGTVSTSYLSSNQFVWIMASDSATTNKYAFINASTGYPELTGIKMRGTTAAPTTVTSTDILLRLSSHGYEGTGRVLASYISFQADGTIAAGIVPSRIRFYVMNAAGSLFEAMGIRSTGALELTTISATAGTVADSILVRNSTLGEVRALPTTSLVASGTQYQLAYYAATGQAVSGLTDITASRALKSDANGLPVAFDTSTEPSLTELSYVKGVTSPIQAQLGTKGLYAANGDGVLTIFTVTHGFAGTPTNIQVTPAGVDSAVPFFVNNIGATTFDVTFTTPPIVGTNNVTFYWTVK